MSANIYWEPVAKNNRTIDTGAPEYFMRVLGKFGWQDGDTLGVEALDGLKAVVEAIHEGDHKSFQQLIDAIEKHGAIRIWAVY